MATTIPNFASDNWAPAHPRVVDALTRASAGAVPAYGDDPWTREALEILRRHLGEEAIPFLVLTGTGANVLSLGSCLRPWEGVICPETAHIFASETGAPEWHLGARLLTVPTPDGKLTPDLVRTRVRGLGNEHKVQPRVISITQATECGTLYSRDELRALTAFAHGAGLLVHMDGARLSNAAAALGCGLGEACAGIDVLSFGATKNGAWCAEAVVFFSASLAEGFPYRRKQGMQLASKMRFVAAQITGLFGDDTWLQNARQANAMARRLADGLTALPGIAAAQAVESNQAFLRLPREHVAALEAHAAFHVWRPEESEYRFVCSFATTAEEVDAFVSHARSILR